MLKRAAQVLLSSAVLWSARLSFTSAHSLMFVAAIMFVGDSVVCT